ncbi:MAG: DUF554 domain-containing protein [Candidatus Bathyarchaeota archaeon]|nr:DUF554 domain-containing protein [Candidatus Bathyarchaeota archaeon]
MQGTLVNAVSVIAGSLIGIVLRGKFPDRVKSIVFQGIGLVTLFIGFQMALKTSNLIILFFSMLIGAVVGEALNIEGHIEGFGNFVKSKFSSREDKFVEGFITAFLIFCMGSMTIVGSIEDGLNGNPSILYAKSMLDGFASISLASVLGFGVLFSAIPLLLYQGGITLLASLSKAFFTEAVVNELSASGGIILIGLGINLLEIRKIRVANLLPSLVFSAAITYLLPYLQLI